MRHLSDDYLRAAIRVLGWTIDILDDEAERTKVRKLVIQLKSLRRMKASDEPLDPEVMRALIAALKADGR